MRRWRQFAWAAHETYRDVERRHMLQMSAALAYYSFFSLFPGCILLFAVASRLPVPRLWDQALGGMADVLPADSMELVREVVSQVSSGHGAFFSVGLLGTVWTLSTTYTALMEALNILHECRESRSYWKRRGLAIVLSFSTGAMLLVALTLLILGPGFGAWLTNRLYLSGAFAVLWPWLRWLIAVVFTILAVELLFRFAPDHVQSFRRTVPGATVAVCGWLGLSYLFGLYVRSLGHFNRVYGAMGGVVILLVWLYLTAFAMLLGADLNVALARARRRSTVAEPAPERMHAA